MTLFFNGKLKRTAQIGAVVGVAALGVTYAAAPVVFASALGYVATALASVGALSILTQLGVVLAAGLSMALLAAAAGALVFCLGHAIYNAAKLKSIKETGSEETGNSENPTGGESLGFEAKRS